MNTPAGGPPSDFGQLMTAVPARIRTAAALFLLDAFRIDVPGKLRPECDRLVALGWSWAGGAPIDATGFYGHFGDFVETALDRSFQENQRTAATVAAAWHVVNYLLWEVECAAFDAGEISTVSSEVAEGDPTIWLELEQALDEASVLNTLPERLWVALRGRYAGKPEDRGPTIRKDDLIALLEQP